ncbi:MAG: class I SAM-dependent methyltransferase [Chloroflexota bacterium]
MEERKFDHHHKGFLDSEERRQVLDPERVVTLLPLEPGQTVGDVGCGTGFFTEPLARTLATGKVIAFDVQPEMVTATAERVVKAGLGNVEVLPSQELDLPVASGTLDGAFVAFVLHETENLPALLKELRRVVRPGGWLAVVEFHRREGKGGPPQHIRLEPVEVGAALREARFLPEADALDLNEQHYLLLARAV